MNMELQIENLKKSNEELVREVELKDSQLKDKELAHQIERANYINVSHLSTVNIPFRKVSAHFDTIQNHYRRLFFIVFQYFLGTKRSDRLFGEWN